MMKKKNDYLHRTGVVKFALVSLVSPRDPFNNGRLEYSLRVMIEKSDLDTLKGLDAILRKIQQDHLKTTFKGSLSGMQKTVRDGDEERPEWNRGYYFMNTANASRPRIGRDVEGFPTIGPEEIRNGDFGRVSVLFVPYNKGMNKGIKAILVGVAKTKDRLELAKPPQDEYEFTMDEMFGDPSENTELPF